MATCTLHFYSLEGERRLSVQTWILIPSYGGKAGFPLSGLVPVLSCFHTAFQSTQSLHFTTSRKHKMSHQESNRSHSSARCRLSLSMSALSSASPTDFSAAFRPGLVSFSLMPFKNLLLPATSSCFWESSKALKNLTVLDSSLCKKQKQKQTKTVLTDGELSCNSLQ